MSIQRYLLLNAAFVLIVLCCDVQARIPLLGLALEFRLGICMPLILLSIFLLGRRLPPWPLGLVALTPVIADSARSDISAYPAASDWMFAYLKAS